MNRFIQRMFAAFAAVFALSVVGVVVYAVYWQAPEQKCELKGSWWDPADRVCAEPIYLPNITHRPIRAKPAPQPPA